MEKVDRLGWTVGFTREYRGLKLGFRADRWEALEVLRELVAPLQAEESLEAEVQFLYSYRGGGQRGQFRDYHLLYQGARKVVRTLDGEELRSALQEEVSLLIAAAAPNNICLRGGAVLWRGRALLVLGQRGQGTSTLVRALVKEGASLLTDSFVLLDIQSGRLLTHGEPDVGGVLLAGFQPRGRFRVRRLGPGEAALALFSVAPAAAVQGQRCLAGVARLGTRLPVFSVLRSSAQSAAEGILKLLDSLYL